MLSKMEKAEGKGLNKVRARGVSFEVIVNSLGEVQAGLVSEDVRNEAFVDIVTRRGFVVEQETIEMGSSPVVDCGGVPVDLDEFGCLHRRMVVRELVISAVCIDEGRTGSQEGNILGPDVLEGVGTEKVLGTDEHLVRVGTSVDGIRVSRRSLWKSFQIASGRTKKREV